MSLWKNIGITSLIIFLIFQRNEISRFIGDCRVRDLFVDSFDYLWTLPQGLRFALVTAFLALIVVAILRIRIQRGGDGKQ